MAKISQHDHRAPYMPIYAPTETNQKHVYIEYCMKTSIYSKQWITYRL